MNEFDAKDVLDYIASKAGFDEILALAYSSNEYVACVFGKHNSLYSYEQPLVFCKKYKDNRSNSQFVIFNSYTSEFKWSKLLKLIFDIASKNDVMTNDNSIVVKKGTTLEQLLIEIELETGLKIDA